MRISHARPRAVVRGIVACGLGMPKGGRWDAARRTRRRVTPVAAVPTLAIQSTAESSPYKAVATKETATTMVVLCVGQHDRLWINGREGSDGEAARSGRAHAGDDGYDRE
eukprot:CAMPEP_0170753642 /NCGR_PEP_ID=MMETSP0437-20130122/12598_1 /TAXON_ID=0 /ORGANISM="Sexangularia sp." /LENGTH=109 /DNA_ID=CAMNT_0011092767 /DNA_START=169 /DNA_END=498 /DNA_ORIENTATION=-